ncbi:MAG: hypothetical protein RL701_1520, partial [Pseudomonadota bacterium]
MFDRLLATLLHGEGVLSGAVLLVVGLTTAALLRGLLVPGHRRRLRAPLMMIVTGATLMILLGWARLSVQFHRWFSIAPVALLLLGYGRLLSVAFFDWLLTRRLQMDAPRIVRDIVDGLFSAFALLITLAALGVETGSLLTTSAVFTAVVGLSLQDTLGNLFAGLSLQAQRPFAVGDWIQCDRDAAQLGRVVEINWRATRLITGDQQELTIPNSMLARSVILNHSRLDGTPRTVQVVLPYEIPTTRVHAVMAHATEGIAGLRATPPVRVLTHGFVDQGIRYELRFYIDHFTDRSTIEALVRDRIWHLLQRHDLPFATAPRGASLQLPGAEAPDQDTRAQAIRKIDFLQGASDEAIATLAAGSHIELYAPGERVVRQGETGEELYLCLSGELKVQHQPEAGAEREIARLQPGGLFGEIAQLTGQAR